MTRKQQNVFPSFAQGRQEQDLETLSRSSKSRLKSLPRSEGRQIGIGRTNDAHIHAHGFTAPHPLKLPVFPPPEESSPESARE